MDAKKEFYQMRGFSSTFGEYVLKLAELDELPEWASKKNEIPTLVPLPYQRHKRNYLSIILP